MTPAGGPLGAPAPGPEDAPGKRGLHPGELLSAYLDRELDPPAEKRVEAHMLGCAPCRAELEAVRAAREAIRGLGRAGLPVLPSTEMAAAPASTRSFSPWSASPRGRRWVVAVAAAAVLTAAALGDGAIPAPATRLDDSERAGQRLAGDRWRSSSLSPSSLDGWAIEAVGLPQRALKPTGGEGAGVDEGEREAPPRVSRSRPVSEADPGSTGSTGSTGPAGSTEAPGSTEAKGVLARLVDRLLQALW